MPAVRLRSGSEDPKIGPIWRIDYDSIGTEFTCPAEQFRPIQRPRRQNELPSLQIEERRKVPPLADVDTKNSHLRPPGLYWLGLGKSSIPRFFQAPAVKACTSKDGSLVPPDTKDRFGRDAWMSLGWMNSPESASGAGNRFRPEVSG